MQTEQAVSVGRHISILQKRVDNLEKELRRVQDEKNNVEVAIQSWQYFRDKQDHEYSQRMLDVDVRFKKEMSEVEKQIALARSLVDKKLDERDALMSLLKQTNLIDDIHDDFDKLNWSKLRNLALKSNRPGCSEKMMEKISKFNELSAKFRSDMQELAALRETVLEIKLQFDKKHQLFKSCNVAAATKNEENDKQIEKYKSENERLNLLIKQCAMSDEPMTEFVSDNIRAKCHSFLETENFDEMLQGLSKFQSRQSRMIKLLRFMECRHIRDCNLLQVALEETTDHTKYYSNLKTKVDTRIDIDFSLNNNGVLEGSSPSQ